MPRHGQQRPIGYSPDLKQSDIGLNISQIGIECAVRLNGETWEKNEFDGNNWVTINSPVDGALSGQQYYDPPFDVRRVFPLRTDEDECTIVYDLRGYESQYENKYQIGITKTFKTGIEDIRRMSRIYLAGSATNITQIHFEG